MQGITISARSATKEGRSAEVGVLKSVYHMLYYAVRCKEKALANTKNRPKNAFGSSLRRHRYSFLVTGRRAQQLRFYLTFSAFNLSSKKNTLKIIFIQFYA